MRTMLKCILYNWYTERQRLLQSFDSFGMGVEMNHFHCIWIVLSSNRSAAEQCGLIKASEISNIFLLMQFIIW